MTRETWRDSSGWTYQTRTLEESTTMRWWVSAWPRNAQGYLVGVSETRTGPAPIPGSIVHYTACLEAKANWHPPRHR